MYFLAFFVPIPTVTMVLDAKDSIEARHSIVYDEKISAPDYLHKYIRAGLSEEDADFMHNITAADQDKIFHKVDWRLCPMLAVLYLISHLDRYVTSTTIGVETDQKQGKHRQCEDRRPRS